MKIEYFWTDPILELPERYTPSREFLLLISRLRFLKEQQLEQSGKFSVNIRKAWTEAKVDEAFATSSWGKKLASSKRRAELNDFERFSAMILKKRRNFAIRHPNGS